MPTERLTASPRKWPGLSPIRRPKTTAKEVEDRLIIAIARGDKLPGERLTETEISAALEISRVPAREAMQKLQLRGILVERGQRGLQVADYGPAFIEDLIGLRLAIERIFFQHVMRPDYDRAPLIVALEAMLEKMSTLSDVGDPLALSTIDLEFHRVIAINTGHDLAIQIWEGLAQHMLIVFCRDWLQTSDRTGEVNLHRKLVDFVQDGDVADLDFILRDHFTGPHARQEMKT